MPKPPDKDESIFFGVYLGIPLIIAIIIILVYALPVLLAGSR